MSSANLFPSPWFAPLPVDEDGWWGPFHSRGSASPMPKPTIDGEDFTYMRPFHTKAKLISWFITRVYKLVEDPASDPFIYWGPDGRSFVIRDQLEFCRDVLPRYFKYECLSKFILELSAYGFSFRLLDHKVMEFAKEGFCRSHSQPLKEEFHTRRPIQSHSLQELEMKGNIEMEGSESCYRIFLAKTYCMVDDPTTDNVLSWVPTGHSFVIPNVLHLYKDLLPRYFEHRDFFKFVLLLCHNGFKFRSSVHLQFEFAKPGFVRGKRHLLPKVYIPKPLQSKHQPLSSREMELEEDFMKIKEMQVKEEIKESPLAVHNLKKRKVDDLTHSPAKREIKERDIKKERFDVHTQVPLSEETK